MQTQKPNNPSLLNSKQPTRVIFAICATFVGVFSFFVSFEFNQKTSIIIDHATSWIVINQSYGVTAYCLILMSYGVFSACFKIYKNPAQTQLGEYFFSLVKLFGLLLACAYVFKFAPSWAMQKMLLPLLFEKIGLTVSVLIPLGAIALSLLVSFGLLEFLGILLQKPMRVLFRLPGYACLDALSSFFGSYSLGLLVTDECVKSRRYSLRDAVIIATGFSTVSVTFMLVVSRTLGLHDNWLFFFISTVITCFVVTAISAWLPPIVNTEHSQPSVLTEKQTGLWSQALAQAELRVRQNPNFLIIIKNHFINALNMVSILVPAVLAVGFIGIALSQYTVFFDYFGVFLKPILLLTGLDIIQYSGGISASIFEMYLPAMMLTDAPLAARFIAGITSISGVLYLAGSIPCIFATSIRISLAKLLIIWLIRMHLSIIIAGLFYRLGIISGWL